MNIRYLPYEAATVASLRQGGPDAYGMPAERAVSDGAGTPCRSCLHDVPQGAGMLICAAMPFPTLQPYAETGPVFFCADDCSPWDGQGMPPVLTTSPDYLLKAYSADHRIIYGTGKITRSEEIAGYAEELLARKGVAFVDVRSARNNCFLTRIVGA